MTATEPAAPTVAASIASSYDEVPYQSDPFPQTHPNTLATIATLFASSPASKLPRAGTRCPPAAT